MMRRSDARGFASGGRVGIPGPCWFDESPAHCCQPPSSDRVLKPCEMWKPAAEVVQPTLDAAQSLPSSVADQIPDNAVTVARINAAVQIGGGLLLATGRIPRVASALLAGNRRPRQPR